MKNFKLIIVLVIVASLASCGDKRTPQMQYMPDMYESIPYNADAENGLKGNPVNSKPVAGTIPRGGHPAYDIADTNEGYEKAKADLKNPLELNEENLANGKSMYTIYCTSCHGKNEMEMDIYPKQRNFQGFQIIKTETLQKGVSIMF